MIKLEVAGYCHECPNFVANVEDARVAFSLDGTPYMIGDTIIRCSNRKKCEMICDYLERKDK